MRRVLLATCVALITIPWIVGPTAAAPTCDGKPATIVRTPGDDVILGTSGRDVIVAKGGDDLIEGRGGGDTICAGGGNDEVDGGGGPDRVLGAGGDDAIGGGPGNDDIDGGRGSDRCRQGGGSGPVRRCERADLSIEVDLPPTGDEGEDINVDIVVTNGGPHRASYSIVIENDNSDATCNGGLDGGIYPQAALDPGQQKVIQYTFQCTVEGAAPKASVEATVVANATDTDGGNDTDSDLVVIIPET